MSGTGEERRRADRAQQVALFRYQLIREAADPALSTRQRGRLVRELAARAHPGPFGDPVSVSRATIDRWIRAWRSGGFDALVPPARQVMPRTDAETLELAAALKREKPGRTAAQVERVLRAHCGWSPSVRTLQRHFERLELATRPDGAPPVTFGRFEATRPNELWTGDALHGPHVAGRKTFLFCFLDDHSPGGDGRPVGILRGHRPAGRRAAPGAGRPRHPRIDLRRQRVGVRRRGAEAGRCPARHQDHPQRAGPAAGPGEDREILRRGPRAVPGRDRRRAAGHQPDRAEQAVHRLGRDRLPRPAAFGDRAAADGRGGWPAPRSPSRRRRSCGRRSCGPSSGSSRPRPPP